MIPPPGYLIVGSLRPYPCPRCATMVRDIRMTTGEKATITDEPDPAGQIVPWPSLFPQAAAEGRRMNPPIDDGPMWSEHVCP